MKIKHSIVVTPSERIVLRTVLKRERMSCTPHHIHWVPTTETCSASIKFMSQSNITLGLGLTKNKNSDDMAGNCDSVKTGSDLFKRTMNHQIVGGQIFITCVLRVSVEILFVNFFLWLFVCECLFGIILLWYTTICVTRPSGFGWTTISKHLVVQSPLRTNPKTTQKQSPILLCICNCRTVSSFFFPYHVLICSEPDQVVFMASGKVTTRLQCCLEARSCVYRLTRPYSRVCSGAAYKGGTLMMLCWKWINFFSPICSTFFGDDHAKSRS